MKRHSIIWIFFAILIACSLVYDISNINKSEYNMLVNVDEFYISTASEFRSFANAVNSGEVFEGKTIYLTNDIDLENSNWIPIDMFYGTFEGNGHVVSNIHLSSNAPYGELGLFACNYGTIRNLGVKNIYYDVTEDIGPLIIGSVVSRNFGLVYSCFNASNINLDFEYFTDIYVGGICGENQRSYRLYI